MANLAPGQYGTATSVTTLDGHIVLVGYITEQARTCFAVLGLRMDGDVAPLFMADGSAAIVGFFDGPAQANAVVAGPAGRLTLVGLAQNPEAGTAAQMFALARFADVDQIFTDGFD